VRLCSVENVQNVYNTLKSDMSNSLVVILYFISPYIFTVFTLRECVLSFSQINECVMLCCVMPMASKKGSHFVQFGRGHYYIAR